MRTIPEMLAGGGYVSGEEISAELGITRAAVWKKIEALRADGWPIEGVGKRGYHLEENDLLFPALWTASLETRSLGRGEVAFAQVIDSTNSQCKRMAAAGAPHGSICLCEQQTAGRGRLGRSWVSAPGVGLWQSVLLRPDLRPEQAPAITLCVALAMAEALRGLTPMDVRIKWPNDLVCGGRKICGILLEMSADPDRVEYVVAGVGLNVLPGAVPPELAEQAACVADFCTPVRRRELLLAYLLQLEKWLDILCERGFEGIEATYRRLSCTIGSQVQVSGAQCFRGTAEGIDSRGALIVRREDGQLVPLLSGDVSVRGVMGYV